MLKSKNPLRELKANLSLKLIFYFILAGLFLAVAMGTFMRFGFERGVVDQIRPHFRHYMQGMNREIGVPPDLEKARSISQNRDITIRIFGQDTRWASDDIRRKPRRARWEDDDDDDDYKGKAFDKKQEKHNKRRFFRDAGKVFILHKQRGYDFYYGFKLRGERIVWFPLIAVTLVLLTLLGFYYFVRRLFAPVGLIQKGVRLIGEGKLGHQIELDRSDEFGQLALDLNHMSHDLSKMMQAKRDLLLALSHELRSPLARSRVSIALLAPSKEQKALLRDQQHIERLIDQILESERNQTPQHNNAKGISEHTLLNRSSIDLKQWLNALLLDEFPEQDIECVYEGDLSSISVDANQIQRLIRNLLHNALRYNRSEIGKVLLKVSSNNSHLSIHVIDHGEGIARKHIEQIFEPFYRVDSARTPRELNVKEALDGGVGGGLDVGLDVGLGLGLYLCKAIVDAHQGEISLSSKHDKGLASGTQVKVSLPL